MRVYGGIKYILKQSIFYLFNSFIFQTNNIRRMKKLLALILII